MNNTNTNINDNNNMIISFFYSAKTITSIPIVIAEKR